MLKKTTTPCERPDDAAIRRAADLVRQGGVVAFPTETVYGLGANALDAAAVGRVFAVKGRPTNNPIIVHVHDTTQVQRVAVTWPDAAVRLAERFWPGPLTMVLAKHDSVPDAVTAGGPTVAVRIPAHPVAQALLAAADLPIAAPSANRSGELSPTTAQHVMKSFDGLIDMVLDGGACPGGIESTVVDVSESPARLLRPGLISVSQLTSIVPDMVIGSKLDHAGRSPGMLPRHYAPRTPLEVTVDDGTSRVWELQAQGKRVGWLTWNQTPEILQCERRSLPDNHEQFASGLFAALHELDELGLDQIVVAGPPLNSDWLAIRDRLRRAAHRS